MSDSAFAPEVRGQAKAFSSLLARSVHRINGNLWFGGTDNEKGI